MPCSTPRALSGSGEEGIAVVQTEPAVVLRMSRVQISRPDRSKAFNTPTPVMIQTQLAVSHRDGDDIFCLR